MYPKPCNPFFLQFGSAMFFCRPARATIFRTLVGTLGILIPLTPGHAQNLIVNLNNEAISLSGLANFTYTQDFNTLIRVSGQSAQLSTLNTPALRGLQIARSGGTASTSTIVADNGNSTGGTVYSYGSSGDTNRRFGTLTTMGSTGDLYYGFRFLNDTNSEITSMNVSFLGEIWRTGQVNLTETLQFSSAVFTAGDGGLGAAGYSTAESSLQYSKQGGSATGSEILNLARFRETKTGIITFAAPVANGQEIWIRWKDTELDGTSTIDNGMSIDDLNVSFTPTPAPPGLITASIGSVVGLLHFGGARRRRRGRQQQA